MSHHESWETYVFWGQNVKGQGHKGQKTTLAWIFALLLSAGIYWFSSSEMQGQKTHFVIKSAGNKHALFMSLLHTHAGCVAAGVGRALIVASVCLSVCLFVRALKGKRLKLSTPNLVHIYSIVVARHALTQRSQGQRSRLHGYENRHGRTVACDACCYGRVLLLPAWVCLSIRLPMFSSYCNCFYCWRLDRYKVKAVETVTGGCYTRRDYSHKKPATITATAVLLPRHEPRWGRTSQSIYTTCE